MKTQVETVMKRKRARTLKQMKTSRDGSETKTARKLKQNGNGNVYVHAGVPKMDLGAQSILV